MHSKQWRSSFRNSNSRNGRKHDGRPGRRHERRKTAKIIAGTLTQAQEDEKYAEAQSKISTYNGTEVFHYAQHFWAAIPKIAQPVEQGICHAATGCGFM